LLEGQPIAQAIVARQTVAQLIDDTRTVLGDGGYRGIPTITGPRRGTDGRIIRDHHYQVHLRIRARVEHVIARLKNWQSPPPIPQTRPSH
jgi:hypothetical protein